VNAGAPQIYLASSSPRRRELLDQIGVRYDVLPVAVDEGQHPGEAPREYVSRLALLKARRAVADPRRVLDLPVLAADTAVVVDAEVLGKPRDREHALAMLARLSGRAHEVLTAVALVHRRESLRVNTTRVVFRTIAPPEATAYWATGEPADKAGSYAVQGLGAVFVTHLEGSYSGVMGLPLFEVAQLLHECGIAGRFRTDGERDHGGGRETERNDERNA
jgi:septum formation protein